MLPLGEIANQEGWYFCLSLRSVAEVPEQFHQTRWYVVAQGRYPWGTIDIRPAVHGGISETYPHQRLNNLVAEPNPRIPWRPGKLCLHDPGWIHEQQALTEEPIGQPGRLQWLMERLLGWVQAAASGTWLTKDERVEIPDFAPIDINAAPFLYLEDETTFSTWQTMIGNCGLFRCQAWGNATLLWDFADLTGKIVRRPAWRPNIHRPVDESTFGIWVLLPRLPVIGPWRAPMAGAEIAEALKCVGFDMHLLQQRKDLREAFTGKKFRLAVGFPVGDRHGDLFNRIIWRVCVEDLAFDRLMRRNPHRQTGRLQAWWAHPNRRVKWQPTENVSPARYHSRGLLPESIRGKQVVLIGCGSLGSQLAESLVRGGATHLTLVDPEHFEAANLVRHSLTSSALGTPKAAALAHRLSMISPTCIIRISTLALEEVLQSRDPLRAEECSLIIDATASDEVRWLLSTMQAKAPILFLRLEFTAGANQGFLTLRRGISLRVEHALAGRRAFCESPEAAQARPPEDAGMEDVGCWSQVFPARHSRVAMITQMLWEDALEIIRTETIDQITHFVVRYQPTQEERANDWCTWTWSSCGT